MKHGSQAWRRMARWATGGAVAALVLGASALGGARPAAAQTNLVLLPILPDLRVIDLTRVTLAGTGYLRVEVRNTGAVAAGPYQVSVSHPTGFGVAATYADANGLPAGGVWVFYHRVGGCPSTAQGTLLTSYRAIADSGSTVGESNEANNDRQESWFLYCS